MARTHDEAVLITFNGRTTPPPPEMIVPEDERRQRAKNAARFQAELASRHLRPVLQGLRLSFARDRAS